MAVQARNITTSDVGRLLGKSDLTVRVMMQKGLLDIGIAELMPGNKRWTYFVSPNKLAEYLGCSVPELYARLDGKSLQMQGGKFTEEQIQTICKAFESTLRGLAVSEA